MTLIIILIIPLQSSPLFSVSYNCIIKILVGVYSFISEHTIQLPYKKSRLSRSTGTNFCDYNRVFYKKLSLGIVVSSINHEIGGFLVIIQLESILIGYSGTIILVFKPSFFKTAFLRYFSGTHI